MVRWDSKTMANSVVSIVMLSCLTAGVDGQALLGTKAPERFVISEIKPANAGAEAEHGRLILHRQNGEFLVFSARGTFNLYASGFRTSLSDGSSFAVLKKGENSPFDGHPDGTVYSLRGKVSFSGYTFESDTDYPLTFKLTKRNGYVHLCGRGVVTGKDGRTHALGGTDSVAALLPRLSSNDVFDREGAAQALGALAKTQAEKDKAVMVLIQALKDSDGEVRRNAAESLGRLGDPRSLEPLTALSDADKEKEDWVRDAAKEALEALKGKPGTSARC